MRHNRIIEHISLDDVIQVRGGADEESDYENKVWAALGRTTVARPNGEPSLRPEHHDGYPSAFVFDLDGHNAEATFFHHR